MATVEEAREGDAEMAIDPRLPVPLWFQLREHLLDEIVAGRYTDGQQLPTEHELCARFGISRTPVHRALAQLADEGVILRHRRKGTFVNPHWAARNTRRPRLRVTIPDGSWEPHLAAAAADRDLSVAAVPLHELRSSLIRGIGEGNAPDLALIDSVWVHEFARAGFLHPLEDLAPDWIAGDYLDQFLQPFVADMQLDGSTWAVQAEADVAGLWYRRDLIDEPPTTWDEWRAVLAATGARVSLPGGLDADEAATYVLLAVLASNSATAVRRETITLTSPPARRALSFLRSMADEGHLADAVATTDDVGAIHMLADGRAGFAIGGSYQAGLLSQLTGRTLDQMLAGHAFAPLPHGPDGPGRVLAGGMVWAVPRQAAHPQSAMDLIRELSRPASLQAMARSSGQLPPRRDALEAVSDVAFLRETGAMLADATLRPSTVSYPRVSRQLAALLEAIVGKAADPEVAARATADRLAAITGMPLSG